MNTLTADQPAVKVIRAPEFIWEVGTAYDFFISLQVLHKPEDFGLRGSWAAGVRSRIPPSERKTLEDTSNLIHTLNLPWIHNLPEPKDGASALWTLARLPPDKILPSLAYSFETKKEYVEILDRVTERRVWEERDREDLRSFLNEHKKHHITQKEIGKILDWWSSPHEFGEGFLSALRAYFEVFFAEEERRIQPVLQEALEKAQEQAQKLDVKALLESLSQGVRFESLDEIDRLILTPSFWSTPFIFYDRIDAKTMIVAFGGRPSGASLVPGEEVPDAMLQALKAMADPTRLRILRYLSGQPMTPSELSRRLRLRAPTVVHHLHALRLAGLVHLTLESGGEKRYEARREMVGATFENIRDFLNEDS
jgi:DNA-binding transcriptional ArsR family regulator/DNA-binding transcriptional MerR regulator